MQRKNYKNRNITISILFIILLISAFSLLVNTWDLPLLPKKFPIAAAVAVMMGFVYLKLATKK